MTFVVIESTPGYLPDDDDPATFEDITDARVYAREEAQRLIEHIEEGQMLDDGDSVVGVNVLGAFDDENGNSVLVYDNSREHDLGRIIEIVEEEA